MLARAQASPLAVALAALVVVLELLPEYVDVPQLPRWIGWAIVSVAGMALVSASLSTSPAAVLGVTGLVAVVAVVLLLLPSTPTRPHVAPDRHRKPGPAAGLRSATLGVDPLATVFAYGRRWVLHGDGTVLSFSAEGAPAGSFRVPGPATGIVACEGALVVVHGRGFASRYSPRTFHRLARYHFGYDSDQVTCGGGFVWVNKRDEGSVVQLDGRTLQWVDEFPLTHEATSIAFGHGVLWASDATTDAVLGVDARSAELIGPMPVMDDPQQVAAAGGGLWVLHRQSSCLRRLDIALGREVGPGVPLGSDPARMRAHGDRIYVSDYTDASIATIDAFSGTAIGLPLRVPHAARLTDVDGSAARLVAIDPARQRLTIVDAAAQAGLAHAAPRRHRSPDCPRTG